MIHMEHAQGHCNTKDTNPLNPMEELNVAADHMANAHPDTLLETWQRDTLGDRPNQMHSKGVSVFVDGVKITSVPPPLRQAISPIPSNNTQQKRTFSLSKLLNWLIGMPHAEPCNKPHHCSECGQ